MTSSDSPAHGRLDLCVRTRSVRFAGREARLPDLSFRLLQVLGKQAPADVSFEQIERAVWGAQVTRETIKQRAKLLREALVGLGVPEEVIASARSVGYRLTVPVGSYSASLQKTAGGRFGRMRSFAAVGGLLAALALATAATGILWQEPAGTLQVAVVEAPPTRGVDAATTGHVARDLSSYLAGLEGVDVLAGTSPAGRASDLIVDLAITGQSPESRLSLRLIDAHSDLILWAEDYPFNPLDYERSLAHFASNVHTNANTLSLRLGRNGQDPQPRAAREEYELILGLTRGAGEQDLLVAKRRLDILVGKHPSFVLARALRVRVVADLVLRHDHDEQLAAHAVAEAGSLVEAYPFAADFKYALARALLASGNDAAALANLQAAARDLPFLKRDIQALERQIAAASAG
jgi:DNA-binding winged helix-turn-helix (wHTH) protein